MSNQGATRRAISRNPRRASTFRKLIQAAVLAVMVVPLGSVAMEAGTMTCGFGGESYLYGGGCGTTSEETKIFSWGPYSIKLEFEGLSGDFLISIRDDAMNPSGSEGEGELANNFESRDDAFEDYECIPIAGEDCVDFVIDAPSQQWSAYNITFFWMVDTNDEFPNGDGPIGQVRVLHNQGGGFLGDYSRDMCLLTGEGEGCVYSATGEIPGDPAIRTRDTDFSSFTVAWVPSVNVPEPSTLLLFGAGASGVLCRRRRRSGKPEADSTS